MVSSWNEQYIELLYHFLDPFNENAAIDPLLELLLKIQKEAKLLIPIEPDYFKPPPKDRANRETSPKDLLRFFNSLFSCLTAEEPNLSVVKLFEENFEETFKNMPSLHDVMELQISVLKHNV